ncbi:hypothetical protein GA0115246_106918 [Streptomyces sp. SolWspMP-sol7th]|nr:hypothetical protein GA0115246_106918 [Streptomyces sp. SolWspMP-sol7th]
MRVGTNLKGTRRAKQSRAVAARTRGAASRLAETWIFQPCGGTCAPAGASERQSPRRASSQPGGTVPSAVAYSSASGRAAVRAWCAVS